ncbi:MAG TPA: hypothetical protein VHK24_13765, partial [Steroidobacter sp.]|nr:hypothetical protein [Steroidobacter sp.]
RSASLRGESPYDLTDTSQEAAMKKELISVLLTTTILSVGIVSAADQDQPTVGADAMFKSLDRDADQRLSKSEVAKNRVLMEDFAALDAESDGYLTKREYEPHTKKMESEK